MISSDISECSNLGPPAPGGPPLPRPSGPPRPLTEPSWDPFKKWGSMYGSCSLGSYKQCDGSSVTLVEFQRGFNLGFKMFT